MKQKFLRGDAIGRVVVLLLGLLSLFLAPISLAQFTANYQTNLISGVVSNWTGDYNVGNTTLANVLLIQPGGVLSNGFGNLGAGSASSNNVAVVAGSGAVWRNTSMRVGFFGSVNSLIISNTGKVLASGDIFLGDSGSSSNNRVLVAGSSSLLSNSTLYVGDYTSGNSLTVSNGGQVVCDSVSVSDYITSGNNRVLVTDPNSRLTVFTTFQLGTSGNGGNTLIVSNGAQLVAGTISVGAGNASGNVNNQLLIAGGTVTTGGLTISPFSATSNNLLRVDGGSLYVTNAAGTAILEIGKAAAGSFILNGGTVTANVMLVDGKGSLNGCGTLSGSVTITGQVTADCGGTLTFTGSVTNNGTMRALNGTVLESTGTLVNNGTIDLTGGSSHFIGPFINNGVVIGGSSTINLSVTGVAREGNDLRITWATTAGTTNALQRTAGVAGGYSTNGFADIFIATNTTGTATNYLDTGAATNFPARYYRIRLVP